MQKSARPPASAVPSVETAQPEEAASEVMSPPENIPTTINYLTFKQEWRKVVAQITAENMTLGTFLSFSFVLSAAPEEIKLGLPETNKFQHQQVTRPDNIKWLNGFFLRNLGYNGRLSLELVSEEKSKTHMPSDTPVFAKKNITSGMVKKENINEAIKKEPILGTILDVFEGEVI